MGEMLKDMCCCCGDPQTKIYLNKFYCRECYNEVAHGVIKQSNINTMGPPGRATKEDGAGPSQHNAIRALEGE